MEASQPVAVTERYQSVLALEAFIKDNKGTTLLKSKQRTAVMIHGQKGENGHFPELCENHSERIS
jgi:hypothetical protein